MSADQPIELGDSEDEEGDRNRSIEGGEDPETRRRREIIRTLDAQLRAIDEQYHSGRNVEGALRVDSSTHSLPSSIESVHTLVQVPDSPEEVIELSSSDEEGDYGDFLAGLVQKRMKEKFETQDEEDSGEKTGKRKRKKRRKKKTPSKHASADVGKDDQGSGGPGPHDDNCGAGQPLMV